MNLSEYRAEVKSAAGIPTTDTGSVPDAELNRVINRAIRDIANTADFPWLFAEDIVNLASGASEFTPPATWVRTEYLTVNVNGRDIPAISKRQLAEWATDKPGTIRAYAVLGNVIRLVPATAEAATLRHGYVRTEPVLAANADSPLIPDAHSEWVINLAALKLAIRTNNGDRITALREEVAKSRALAMDNLRKSKGALGIRLTKPSVWQDV